MGRWEWTASVLDRRRPANWDKDCSSHTRAQWGIFCFIFRFFSGDLLVLFFTL